MDEFEIRHELERLDNSELVSIIKNTEEENILRLELAWEILDERGIKDKVLEGMEKEAGKEKLSMEDLLNASDDDNANSDEFAGRVEQSFKKEIFINDRNTIGVLKSPNAFQEETFVSKISEEEKQIAIRKMKIRLFTSSISFVLAVLLITTTITFKGKVIAEGALLAHCVFGFFHSYAMYRIVKDDN